MKTQVRMALIAALGIGIATGVFVQWPTGPVAHGVALAESGPPIVAGEAATMLGDGTWLLTGGNGPRGPIGAARLWNPSSGVASELAARLRSPRTGHTSTLLPDGTVLIVGGLDAASHVVPETELFDPRTRTFRSLANEEAPSPRALHAAMLLLSGDVLFAGGMSDTGTSLDAVELWNARTHTRTVLEDVLSSARTRPTMTLLPNGTVLLSGGEDAADTALDAGELFDPASRQLTPLASLPVSPVEVGPARVEESIPADGAVGVPLEGLVGLRFSKPLAVSSVSPATVGLADAAGPVDVTVVPAEGGLLAFVVAATALRPDSEYALTLGGLEDGTGLPVEASTVRFRTASRSDASAVQSPRATAGQGTVVGEPVSSPTDDEVWGVDVRPSRRWRTDRPESPWQSLPPLQASAGVTALAGQVLRLNGKPLRNVRLEIGGSKARTDRTGRFLIRAGSGGHHEVLIDGGARHGIFEVGVDIVNGQTTALPYTIWLPKLDQAHAVTIPSPTTNEVVVTTPAIPGLEVRIPAGTVLRDHDGKVVTRLSITPVPLDRPPFPLPPDVAVPLYFTLQPGGTYVQNSTGAGARLIYPNHVSEPPGARFDFWNYDAEERGWYVYGRGTVSASGAQVVPDGGVAVYEFTGAMVASPPFAPSSGPPPGGPCFGGTCGGGCGGAAGGAFGGGGCDGGSADSDGEPVNLATGLFLVEHTDLYLPDVVPIVLRRTYRQNDGRSRALGMSTTHSYDFFLIGDTFPYTYAELVLPDGGRIHYDRTSPGTSFTDAEYETASGPTPFYKSRIVWNGVAWDLTLKDGTVYTFPDAFNVDRPQRAGVVAIRDRFGNTLTITRDGNGTVTKMTSPNGRYINFTAETVPGATPAQYRLKTATDNAGRQVVYNYDTSNRLTEVQDVGGGITTYAYDGTSDRLLTIRSARQNEECPLPGCSAPPFLTNQFYTSGTAAGLVQKQTLGDGSQYQFAYTFDGSGRITQTHVTYPRFTLPTRRALFNTAGYIVSDTAGLNTSEARTVTYERNAGNLVTSVTEPVTDTSSRTTTYDYDSSGDLLAVTRLAGTADALQTQFTYEPIFHQIATITDPLSHVTTFAYNTSDPKRRLQSLTDATGRRTNVTLNTAGRLSSVTNPFLVNAPPPVLETTAFTYDHGDLATTTDPAGNVTTRFVDAAGRVLGVRNQLGRLTRYAYDPHNRVTRITDPLGGVTSFTYDRHGNLKTVEDARQALGGHHVTTYGYDARDRQTSRQDPLGRTETFAYDAAGNVTNYVDRRGVVADFQYDGLDRRICAGYGRTGGGADCTVPSLYERAVGYTWDRASRLREAADSVGGTVVRSYDAADRLVSEVAPPRGSVTYTYVGDRRRTMTVSGQASLCYEYDEADRLVGIRQGSDCAAPLVVAMTVDGAGRRESLSLPGSVSETYTYNSRSLVSGIEYRKQDGTLLGNLSYDYDGAGRQTLRQGSFSQTGLSTAVTSATYDDANELTQWVAPSATVNLTHDANGNVQSDGTNSYTWNASNQLVSTSGGVAASFAYDGFDRRLSRTVDGIATQFLYDASNPVQELSGGGTPSVLANILTGFGADEYFARTTIGGSGSVRRSFLRDALGSTIRLADDNGTLDTSYTYGPFGTTTIGGASPDTSNALQFAGRENDGTGLYYYRARYYAPAWGRFISEDPLGFDGDAFYPEGDVLGGIDAGNTLVDQFIDDLVTVDRPDVNVYSYVTNDPLDWVDPDGLAKKGGGHGKGERGWGGKNPNPGKVKSRPTPGGAPGQRDFKDKQTGKWVTKPVGWKPLLCLILLLPWPGNPLYGGL